LASCNVLHGGMVGAPEVAGVLGAAGYWRARMQRMAIHAAILPPVPKDQECALARPDGQVEQREESTAAVEARVQIGQQRPFPDPATVIVQRRIEMGGKAVALVVPDALDMFEPGRAG